MTRPWIVLLLAAALGPLACEPLDCNDQDDVLMKMTGDCATEPRTFTLSASQCRLTIRDASGPIGLPTVGALSQSGEPIRQGGWQLFGPVEAEFRRCTARRVSWHLEVACTNAAGAPVCQATLTE